MSNLTQIDFLGELAPNGAGQVLVVAESAARQGPLSPLWFECTLPQQHVKCGFPGFDVGVKASNLEHGGQHLMSGDNMWHVFDYKSKTSTELRRRR